MLYKNADALYQFNVRTEGREPSVMKLREYKPGTESSDKLPLGALVPVVGYAIYENLEPHKGMMHRVYRAYFFTEKGATSLAPTLDCTAGSRL